MFGLGPTEMVIIILVAVLIIFGPKQLPKLGKMFGKTMKEVRKGIDGMNEEMEPDNKPAEIVAPAAPVSGTASVACPKCGTPSDPGTKFCPECGETLVMAKAEATAPSACPKCGTVCAPGTKFCPECGTTLN